jgi:hypothetical protein
MWLRPPRTRKCSMKLYNRLTFALARLPIWQRRRPSSLGQIQSRLVVSFLEVVDPGRQIRSGQRPVAPAEARGCLPAHGSGDPLYRHDGVLGPPWFPAASAAPSVAQFESCIGQHVAAARERPGELTSRNLAAFARPGHRATGYERVVYPATTSSKAKNNVSGCRGNLRTSNSKARTVW